MTNQSSTPDVDAVIVGAGFAGLYSLYKLRELGFTARAFEAGDDVGGTWYWNRYPGARCDIESMFYSYQFDDDLQQEWEWTERYSTQQEILAYAQHVADRFDLRRDIRFETLVTAAHWDDDARMWSIETDKGDRVAARHVILGTGNLSSTNLPKIDGIGNFAGPVYHTGRWPHEGVDFTGKRVAVIGTGSSAIQSIPEIAKQADFVTVFQRTANYTIPAWNGPLDPKAAADIKANYKDLREKARHYFTCNIIDAEGDSAIAIDDAERQAGYERKWREGGLGFIGAYRDLLVDEAANKTAADFVKAKIREIVKDPATAEDLTPTNVIGCKRLCVDTDYWATYNRENVRLVNLQKTPIDTITADGIDAGGAHHAADALVCATGFDAMTGTILKIDIRGRGGLRIQDAWEGGPRTYLGLATAGFPNMFTITGPGSPSVLANMIPAIEQHVEFIAGCLTHMRETGAAAIEPTPAAQDNWVAHVNDLADGSLRSACDTWYIGANVPGKARVFMPYIGGFPLYCETCEDVAADNYRGFAFG